MGFIPIGIGKYVQLHVKANPDENPKELLARLRSCVSDALAGARCSCGAPIWVVGSVSAGYACFTCITGEAFPAEDYEIDRDSVCEPVAALPKERKTYKLLWRRR
jgi:hypothetical protein